MKSNHILVVGSPYSPYARYIIYMYLHDSQAQPACMVKIMVLMLYVLWGVVFLQ